MAELPESDQEAGTPRWVKIFGVLILVAVLLVVTFLIVGGGAHGPARHMP